MLPQARVEPALLRLCALAFGVSLVVSLLIILFRLAIAWPLHHILHGGVEDFESLAAVQRTVLILSGGLSLWLLLRWVAPNHRQLSVSHVIDRLHNHQGQLPLRNGAVQFAGGVLALVSGHCAGQEGPIIHIGAGASAQMAQWFRLPPAQGGLLVASGVAAAIGACFDTPLAGVILAMEVVLLSYNPLGFLPVMLAAVTGAELGQLALGRHTFASTASLTSQWQLPYLLAGSVLIAGASALFIHMNLLALKFSHWALGRRIALASGITAAAAWFWPEIMGLGYDTLDMALSGRLMLGSLLCIGLLKVVVSPLTVGLGIPGGLIGPTLFSGGCLGGALGVGAQYLYGAEQVALDLYVLLGMAAMMAATLKAPLAALAAVLELSHNSQLIFPAMVMIAGACLAHRQLFKLDGIFMEQLNHTGRGLIQIGNLPK